MEVSTATHDCYASDDGNDHPGYSPGDPGDRATLLGTDEGEDEYQDLESLSKDGEEGHSRQCSARTSRQFRRRAGAGVLHQVLREAAHPDHHVGHGQHRGGTHNGFEPVFGDRREVDLDETEDDGDDHTESGGGG